MKIGFIAAAAGLAVGAAAYGDVRMRASLRSTNMDGTIELPVDEVAPRVANMQDATMTVSVKNGFGALSRGSMGERGAPVVIENMNDCESLPLLPATFNNIFSATSWVNHPLSNTTPNFWQSQITAFAGVVDEVISGNATKKVRLLTSTAQPPDLFFTGWRVNMVLNQTGATTYNRLNFRSDPTQVARGEHEAWNSNIEALWSSELIHATSGFITDRILWGGTCNEPDCPDFGLPIGPIEGYYFLGQDPNSFTTGIFIPCLYIGSAPPGKNVGDLATFPVMSWHNIVHELDGDRMKVYIDYYDGNGEFLIMDNLVFLQALFDSIRGNASYESQGATHYVDNIFMIGVQNVTPIAPPLECSSPAEGGQYLDDLEWLNPGPLKDQNPRWFDALSSKANVDVISGDQKIRQSNVFPDNYYREEFRTGLPQNFAFPGNPLEVCADARLSAANVTMRSMAIRSTASSALNNPNVTARLFYGYNNPNDTMNPFYLARLYTQINASYEPLDDPTGAFDGNYPVIGSDIQDIGPFTLAGADKIVCLEFNSAGQLTVRVNGVQQGAGLSTLNGLSATARLGFESQNDDTGTNDQFRTDDITLNCATLPDVTYPAFAYIYHDDLENYIVDVPIGAQVDPTSSDIDHTGNRWISTSTAYVRDINVVGAGTSQVLELENLFRDTPPVEPGGTGFAFFTDATTQLPETVWAAGARGWAVGGRFMLTDGATTRVWRPLANGEFVDQFLVCTSVAFSSVTGTLWIQKPNPADDLNSTPPVINTTVWENTGRSLASLGIAFGQWFKMMIHMNVDNVGNVTTITYRINNNLLRDGGNNVIKGEPLRSLNSASQLRRHRNLNRLTFAGGDDDTAGPGSIMYVDDVRAWRLPCPGDTNNDGRVLFADFSTVLAQYTQVGKNLAGNVADANGDGIPDNNIVDFADFSAVLGNYGNDCN